MSKTKELHNEILESLQMLKTDLKRASDNLAIGAPRFLIEGDIEASRCVIDHILDLLGNGELNG